MLSPVQASAVCGLPRGGDPAACSATLQDALGHRHGARKNRKPLPATAGASCFLGYLPPTYPPSILNKIGEGMLVGQPLAKLSHNLG